MDRRKLESLDGRRALLLIMMIALLVILMIALLVILMIMLSMIRFLVILTITLMVIMMIMVSGWFVFVPNLPHQSRRRWRGEAPPIGRSLLWKLPDLPS